MDVFAQAGRPADSPTLPDFINISVIQRCSILTPWCHDIPPLRHLHCHTFPCMDGTSSASDSWHAKRCGYWHRCGWRLTQRDVSVALCIFLLFVCLHLTQQRERKRSLSDVKNGRHSSRRHWLIWSQSSTCFGRRSDLCVFYDLAYASNINFFFIIRIKISPPFLQLVPQELLIQEQRRLQSLVSTLKLCRLCRLSVLPGWICAFIHLTLQLARASY